VSHFSIHANSRQTDPTHKASVSPAFIYSVNSKKTDKTNNKKDQHVSYVNTSYDDDSKLPEKFVHTRSPSYQDPRSPNHNSNRD
jgi:hypothetical protein